MELFKNINVWIILKNWIRVLRLYQSATTVWVSAAELPGGDSCCKCLWVQCRTYRRITRTTAGGGGASSSWLRGLVVGLGLAVPRVHAIAGNRAISVGGGSWHALSRGGGLQVVLSGGSRSRQWGLG